jgi:hypothetical protein
MMKEERFVMMTLVLYKTKHCQVQNKMLAKKRALSKHSSFLSTDISDTRFFLKIGQVT